MTTRYCPNCRTGNSDTAKFCANCGSPFSDPGEDATATIDQPGAKLASGSMKTGGRWIAARAGAVAEITAPACRGIACPAEARRLSFRALDIEQIVRQVGAGVGQPGLAPPGMQSRPGAAAVLVPRTIHELAQPLRREQHPASLLPEGPKVRKLLPLHQHSQPLRADAQEGGCLRVAPQFRNLLFVAHGGEATSGVFQVERIWK